MSAAAAAGAAQQQANLINAVRSFGVVCTVEQDEFMTLVSHQECPLVLTSVGGIFTTEYRYLTSYKGIAFFCKTPYQLQIPDTAETVQVKNLVVPSC